MLDLFYVLFQIALLFPLLWASNWLWRKYTPYDENIGLTDNQLSASSIVYIGYMLSVACFMILAFYGESHGFLIDMSYIFGLAILSNLLIIAGFKIYAFLLSYQLMEKESYIYKAIEQNNMAIAVYKFFALVSMGILILIANYHRDLKMFDFFTMSIPLFICGFLIVFFLMLLAQYSTSYNEAKELKDANLAVAFSIGGVFLSLSLLVGNVLAQVQVMSLDSLIYVINYSLISYLFITFLPNVITYFLRFGILSKGHWIQKNKEINDLIADGNIDIALLQAVVRIIFAVVVVYAVPFNLF